MMTSGSPVVVDSSALLAVVFAGESAEWVARRLAEAPSRVMSTVNLAEVLIRVRDRFPLGFGRVEDALLSGGIEFVAPDAAQARAAAEARLRFPLNLGDCFAYALARSQDLPLLTLDSDFRATDCDVILPPRA